MILNVSPWMYEELFDIRAFWYDIPEKSMMFKNDGDGSLNNADGSWLPVRVV